MLGSPGTRRTSSPRQRTRRDAPSPFTTPFAGHGDGGASPRRAGPAVAPNLREGQDPCPDPTSYIAPALPQRRRPAVPVTCPGCRGRAVTSLRVRWCETAPEGRSYRGTRHFWVDGVLGPPLRA